MVYKICMMCIVVRKKGKHATLWKALAIRDRARTRQ